MQPLKLPTLSVSRKKRNLNSEAETARLAGSKVICILILKDKLTSWEMQTQLKCGAGVEKPQTVITEPITLEVTFRNQSGINRSNPRTYTFWF